MTPSDFAGLIVDRFDDALAPDIVVGAGPTVDPICRLREIDAPARVGIHDEQAVLGVKTRGTIVGHPAFVRRDEASVGSRLLRGIWNRTAFLIDSECPIHRTVWNC